MIAQDYLKVGNKAALGFGGMRFPDTEATSKMVDAYLDAGFNFFDTAWIYGGSEEKLKKTLVNRHPRDSFVMANKIPPWEVNTTKDCVNLFNEQLRRTGLDYFDFYLVHSLDDGREQEIEDKALFPWVVEQKKKGLVRHVGFSFHGSTECLGRILEKHPESEFVLLQLNYMDILRGPAAEWQKMAIKHHVPIFVMEPVRGGFLATLPPTAEKLLKEYAPSRSVASWAIQYAATLEGVTCVFSGMSNMGHVQDNINTFKDLKPLTPNEMDLLEKVMQEVSKVSTIPCTACRYCHNECPQDIKIAESISLFNDVKRGAQEWNLSMVYNTLPKDKKAANCTGCGRCLPHCPQKINIPKELEVVAKRFK